MKDELIKTITRYIESMDEVQLRLVFSFLRNLFDLE